MSRTRIYVVFGAWVLVAAMLAAMITLYLELDRLRMRGDAPAVVEHQIEYPTPLYDVPAFSFIDQDGRKLTNEDLKGHVWLADFIFTRCPGPCPLMTSNMAAAQKAVGDADVRFVSFSIDPEYDQPAVLKRYAREHGADESRWRFVTGDPKAILDFAKGLHLSAIPATANQGIEHDTHFVLVDQKGRVCGLYDGQGPDGWRQAAADAVKLAR